MVKYVAFVWDSGDLPAEGEVRNLIHRYERCGWSRELDCVGAVMLTRAPPSSTQRFHCGVGVLLGSIFPHPDRCPFGTAPLPLELAPGLAARIIETRGQELIEHYWGDYVVFFQELARPAIHVLRGPAADIDCLNVCFGRIQAYASDIESLSLCNLAFAIDWPGLARSFLGPDFPGRTHLENVRQLSPGCSDEISVGQVRSRTLWRVADIAREGFEGDRSRAAHVLRAVTRACVQARASEFPTIVVGLSGGLDSSITLSCLADAPTTPRIISLTQFVEGDDSDEREFARRSAARAGCELIEYRRRDDVALQTAVHDRLSAICPGLRIPSVDRIEPDFATSVQARAIFRGHGGDELYNRNRPSLQFQDRLRHWPWTRECLSLAAHAAVTEGETLWAVLYGALRRQLFPVRWNLRALFACDIAGTSLLRDDVVAELAKQPDSSPFMADVTGLPPGKLWQLSLLCARRNFSSPFDLESDPVPVSPLLSQPVIELCLRIPSWYQIHSHRDRALARDAFYNDLDPQVARRMDKGGGEMLATAILDGNRPFLREMLLEGHLASSQIVDRQRLEQSLSDAPSPLALSSAPLFDLLGAEIWARAVELRGRQNRYWNVSASERRSLSPYRFAR